MGDYDPFPGSLCGKKGPAGGCLPKRQQQEISELKDFVARNKARVATRNMAMSRQKKLDKMDLIQLGRREAQAGIPLSKQGAHQVNIFLKLKTL